MSKFNIFDADHDWLASDRLVEKAEPMLDLLKEAHSLLTDPEAEPEDANRLIEKLEAMINHVETGE
ncbi:MAG: hypothetical protein EB015_14120 [Methylocystaceae bacterium]|nr:hypothetical protein [Methylocystaceae bacterium]